MKQVIILSVLLASLFLTSSARNVSNKRLKDVLTGLLANYLSFYQSFLSILYNTITYHLYQKQGLGDVKQSTRNR